MVKCEGHDELVKAAGRSSAIYEEHSRQLSKMFILLETIQSSIDQSKVRAEFRDLEISKLSECISSVDRKIENGLRSEVLNTRNEVREISGIVKKVLACMNATQDDIDHISMDHIVEKRGFWGFVRPGWIEFKKKASFISVTASILFSAWLIIWVLSKLTIFKEGPAGLLKLFGIAG